MSLLKLLGANPLLPTDVEFCEPSLELLEGREEATWGRGMGVGGLGGWGEGQDII